MRELHGAVETGASRSLRFVRLCLFVVFGTFVALVISFLIHDASFAAFVSFDQVFGYDRADWDIPSNMMNPDSWKRLMQQLGACNKADKVVIAVHCSPEQFGVTRHALDAAGFKDTFSFYVYKSKLNMTGFFNYLNAVDVLCIGCMPGKREVRWGTSANPLERHNMMVANRGTMLKDSAGEEINPTQKAPEITRMLSTYHATPRSNVLVLGGGAGGDVIGALQAGHNVVSVERERRQHVALAENLLAMQHDRAMELEKALRAERKQAEKDKKSFKKAMKLKAKKEKVEHALVRVESGGKKKSKGLKQMAIGQSPEGHKVVVEPKPGMGIGSPCFRCHMATSTMECERCGNAVCERCVEDVEGEGGLIKCMDGGLGHCAPMLK